MSKRIIQYTAFAFSLALFGAGCITITTPPATTPAPTPAAAVPVAEAPVPAETATPTPALPTPPAPVCPQTPQVYYFNKLAFSSAELASIDANVVQSLIAYYDSLSGQEIVSIVIRRTDSGISVESVFDQADSTEPVFNAFIHPRTGGTYPLWVPDVPLDYHG